jgi:hypothetical protein
MDIKQSIRNFLKRSKLLRKLVQSTRTIKSRYFKKIIVIEGKELKSQQLLTVLFSGDKNNMYYVIDTLFGDTEIQIHELEIWSKRVWRYAQRSNAKHDLAIIQADTIPHEIKSTNKAFILPSWVGGVKDLNKGIQLAGQDSQIKSDIRRIRKNRLGYRVTNNEKDFERFYHEMYLPYIKKIYGNFAFLMTHDEMKATFPQSKLFLITQDGEDIAGGIHVYDGTKQVRAWSIGVKGGDREWVKMGALSALEYFETVYLLENGYLRLHRGASRPFLNDGVLRFKLKRGMTITNHTERSLVLFPLNNTPGVCEFLQNNPFLYVDGEKLHGAIFISSDTPCNQDIANSLYKKCFASDAVNLNIFSVIGDGDSGGFIRPRGRIDTLASGVGAVHILR